MLRRAAALCLALAMSTEYQSVRVAKQSSQNRFYSRTIPEGKRRPKIIKRADAEFEAAVKDLLVILRAGQIVQEIAVGFLPSILAKLSAWSSIQLTNSAAGLCFARI